MQPGVMFLVNSLGIGGAERHAVSLLNNLDCKVYRLSLGYLKPDRALLPELRTERLEAVISLNVKHKLDFGVVSLLADYVNEHDIEVIVSANPYPTLYAMLAGRRSRTSPRQVTVFHTTVTQNLKDALQMRLYRGIFRRVDLLVYVSQLQREHWNARGLHARHEVVINNGIDTDHFTDRFTSTQKQALRAGFGFLATDYVIGLCAVLRPEKAHGDFLLALARLRSSGTPAKGLIIGDGPERAAIDRRIAQLGLAHHVAVTGFQSDVRPFIAACDVMTLTSHAVETFSLAALESMSMGKPVVLTQIGGAAEQVEPGVTGFLFAPGDMDALTGTLSTLASPERRVSMGGAAAASVRERFRKSTMIAAYSNQLANLVDMGMKQDDERVRVPGRDNRSVMFLVPSLTVGGSERKTVRLANAIAAANRQVVLAYLSPPESLLSQLHSTVASVNLQRRGKFSIQALRRLATILRERNVSTLVAVNLYSALYAVLAKLLSKNWSLRVVVSVNTTEFATRKEELQMLIYRHILQRADVVVFGAERQRRLWRSRYGLQGLRDKTIVLYNGVDTLEFSKASVAPARLGKAASRVMLGTVGAFRVEKAQIDLVRAVHELARRGVDVGAIIVGEGPQRPEIEREIRRLGVEQRVWLVGEAQDVRPYLAMMDIFVLPSVAVETFSNAALEAMAMSCPVVVARVGGMDEMLRYGGGMTYPPGDVSSLCELLMPLVADAHARRDLGEQARQAAEKHFSFCRMLNDFQERVLDAG